MLNSTMTTLIRTALAQRQGLYVPAELIGSKPQSVDARVMRLIALANDYNVVLDPRAVLALTNMDAEAYDAFSEILLSWGVNSTGAALKTARMVFPNFPEQVQSMTREEIAEVATLHYLAVAVRDFTGLTISSLYEDITGLTWDDDYMLPEYETEKRGTLTQGAKTRLITLWTDEDVHAYARSIMGKNAGMSEAEAEFLKAYVAEFVSGAVDSELFQRATGENKARLLAALPVDSFLWDAVVDSMNTHEILQAMVAYSGYNPAIVADERIRFKKTVPTRIRKAFVRRIDRSAESESHLLRYKGLWKTLARTLHLRSYAGEGSPLNVLYADKHEDTVTQKLHRAVRGDVQVSDDDLRAIPSGLFMRNVWAIVANRKTKNDREVKELAHLVYDKAMNAERKIVMQALTRFTKGDVYKGVAPMKSMSASMVAFDSSAKMGKTTKQVRVGHALLRAVKDSALTAKVGDLYGKKVYISPDVAGILLPSTMRDVPEGAELYGRGTVLPLPKLADGSDPKVVRGFVHWKNQEYGRVDIDLSATVFSAGLFEDSSTVKMTRVGWNAAYSDKGVTFSGDVTDAPQGASEYIDVDLDAVAKEGNRYVSMQIHSFTLQSFIDIPELFAGVMVRPDADSGEVYEPKSVSNLSALSLDAKATTTLLIDVVDKTYMVINSRVGGNYRVDSPEETKDMFSRIKNAALISMKKAAEWTAEGQEATLVDDPALADVVIDLDTDLNEFMAEWI